MTEYAILAILFLRVGLRNEKRRGPVIIVALIGCLIYAILDEYHQNFVVGRAASYWDVVIDEIGALAGTAIFFRNR